MRSPRLDQLSERRAAPSMPSAGEGFPAPSSGSVHAEKVPAPRSATNARVRPSGAIAPLTFAGLRYTIAALLLLPFAIRPIRRARPDRRSWARVLTLGVLFYAVTQGAQYVALDTLPSAAVSLVLTATPVAVFAWSA